MPRPKSPDNPVPRNLRVPTEAWDRALARARAEGTNMVEVCADLIEGYARGVYTPTVRKVRRDPSTVTVRSIRVPKRAWDQANRVAEAAGVTRREACNVLIEAYADGSIDMPSKRIVRSYAAST